MKLTKQELKQIIAEEVKKTLEELEEQGGIASLAHTAKPNPEEEEAVKPRRSIKGLAKQKVKAPKIKARKSPGVTKVAKKKSAEKVKATASKARKKVSPKELQKGMQRPGKETK
tara:strand:- start:114 stop:455 length:342 start_codon:yes stop_codon:yes gene_type:complete